jgi:K+-sensing histidine kinase KdpD
LKPSSLKGNSISQFLNELVKPLQSDINGSLSKIKFDIQTHDVHDELKVLTLDWSIVQCILYQIVGNSIKHCKASTIIEISVTFDLQNVYFSVKNKSDNINYDDWQDNVAPLFSYERAGWR